MAGWKELCYACKIPESEDIFRLDYYVTLHPRPPTLYFSLHYFSVLLPHLRPRNCPRRSVSFLITIWIHTTHSLLFSIDNIYNSDTTKLLEKHYVWWCSTLQLTLFAFFHSCNLLPSYHQKLVGSPCNCLIDAMHTLCKGVQGSRSSQAIWCYMVSWRELLLVYLSQKLDEKFTETKLSRSRLAAGSAKYPSKSFCLPTVRLDVRHLTGRKESMDLTTGHIFGVHIMHLHSFYRTSFPKVWAGCNLFLSFGLPYHIFSSTDTFLINRYFSHQLYYY